MNSTHPTRVAIVLVNFNGTADTLKCLDSLRRLQTPEAMVVVVDNGSIPDESATIAAAFPEIALVRRTENGGWAGGNNAGIDYALERDAHWVLLLNNDTTVAPELIDRLLSAAEAHPRYGILGPLICFMDESDVVMTDGCDFNPPGFPGFFRRHPVPVARSEPPSVTEVDIVNGCCMMVNAAVFRQIGPIDERFFLIHEESDLCLRAQLAGFGCGVISESLVWHKGSSSFRREGRGLQRYYDTRNLFLLLKNHRKSCRGGRGRLVSWFGYARYAYHRYCVEREYGETKAAEAVVRGLCDALMGRYGAERPGPRALLPWLRGMMEVTRRVRSQLPRRRGYPA